MGMNHMETAVVGHVEPGSSGGGLVEVRTGLGDPVLRGRLRRRGLPCEDFSTESHLFLENWQ